MQETKTLDRRTFTLESALAILSGVAITISGCGGSSYDSTPTPAAGDKVGSISANHGHTAVIVAAQLAAGGAISLDIRGSADHTHTVALTGADITAIAANQRVSQVSTSTDHSHTVTFN
jgi:hypothetical protein